MRVSSSGAPNSATRPSSASRKSATAASRLPPWLPRRGAAERERTTRRPRPARRCTGRVRPGSSRLTPLRGDSSSGNADLPERLRRRGLHRGTPRCGRDRSSPRSGRILRSPRSARWHLAPIAAPQTIFTKINMCSDLVGMARFELAASCSQSRRANQAAPHPEDQPKLTPPGTPAARTPTARVAPPGARTGTLRHGGLAARA
jgi:hypothetical protein